MKGQHSQRKSSLLYNDCLPNNPTLESAVCTGACPQQREVQNFLFRFSTFSFSINWPAFSLG